MKKAVLFLAIVLAMFGFSLNLWASSGGSGVSPDEALRTLEDGNTQYLSGAPKHPHADKDRRELTSAKGQHPIATVLSCSDSRVPVEILFDSGIGDIFVIRVAGNVADTDEIGSIEYGVDHLGTPLLVILGHTQCGAVTAVVQKAEVHGNIPPLVDNIEPVVSRVREKQPNLSGDALVEAAVEANVWQAIKDILTRSEVTRERVKSGNLRIVGAIYDLNGGEVRWLGPHPEQRELLTADSAADNGHKK